MGACSNKISTVPINSKKALSLYLVVATAAVIVSEKPRIKASSSTTAAPVMALAAAKHIQIDQVIHLVGWFSI